MPAGFLFGNTLKTELNKSLASKFKYENIVSDVGENFVWLNDSLMQATQLNASDIKTSILSTLRLHPEIHFAIDMEKVQTSLVPQPIREMAINGFVSKRSGDILLILNPAWLDAYAKTGTTHGTWNPYDTHIPLLWYGWGIQKGKTIRTVHMTDIAATVASLLHIQMPNACVGEAISEVIR